MKPKRLTELEPAEVSLVTRGANKRKFLVYKSQKGNPGMKKEILDLIAKADPKALKKVEAVIKEYCAEKADTAAGALQNPSNQQAGPSERAIAALKAAARILTPFKEEVGGELLQKVMSAAGMQQAKEPATISEGGSVGATQTSKSATQSPEPIKDEHMVVAMKAAEDAMKESLAKLGYQKYPEGKLQMKALDKKTEEEDEDEADDVSKSATVSKSQEGETKVAEQVLKADGSLNLDAIPKEARGAIEHIFKAQQELVKKNADLSKELEDRKAAEEKREIVAKADSFTHLGLAKDEVIATLTDARKLGSESYIRVCKQFETLSEQGRTSGIFSEIGSDLPGEAGGPTGDGAWAKIEKAAQGYVAKSGEKLSKEAGLDSFLQTAEGQRMYADYKAGRKGGI